VGSQTVTRAGPIHIVPGVSISALEELPGWARDLLESARVARLGLLDDRDRPRVLPVTFALAEGAAWTAVDRKPKRSGVPARLRYLRRRPEAALTVDRYEDDWDELAWVQLLCAAEVLTIEEARTGLDALTEKYGQYRHEPPPGPVIRLAPTRALWWRASE
jgi:PPOX class probable F420-dependent enzyme